MKRILIAAAVAAVALASAATAFAAINNYTASYAFHGSGKGSKSKPASLSFTQTINVTAATAGSRTGILHQIKTTIAGVKVDAAGLPTCTAAKINAASDDSGCPKKALVATGSITATIGAATDFTQPGSACDPQLDVWNGGGKKLIFFFVETAAHQCLGGSLHTGQVPPWTGSYSQSGSKLNVTIPVPNTVDYPLGQAGGEVGSLSSETLDWKSSGIKSIGCSGKRKYTYSFNATLPGQPAEVKSVSGAASCG